MSDWSQTRHYCRSLGERRKLWLRLSEVREVAQSCPTLCDPMDCSLPGSSIHGIFQARVLEWVAISFSKGFKSLFHLLKNCPCRAGSFTAQENYLKPSLPSSPVPSRRVSELFSLFSHLSLFAFPFASISCLSTSDPWSFLLLQSRWWMYMPQVFSAPLQSCLFPAFSHYKLVCIFSSSVWMESYGFCRPYAISFLVIVE